MKTVNDIIEFGRTINIDIDPKQVFVDSQGAFSVKFDNMFTQQRFATAIAEFFRKQNYLGDLDLTGESEVADWEKRHYIERNKAKTYN